MKPLRVFVGFDPRQPVAAAVAAHSVMSRASVPVAITMLKLDTLPIKRRGLTEFTYSRFLVPWLCDYDDDLAIFMDSDVLCLGDVSELAEQTRVEPFHDVYVVKNVQKFEWASLMVFAPALCSILTPEYVEHTGNALFDFKWAMEENDDGDRVGVGSLTGDWNHLVGYSKPEPTPRLIHYTMGIPVWPETMKCEYAREWTQEFVRMSSTCAHADLMAGSVHAKGTKA